MKEGHNDHTTISTSVRAHPAVCGAHAVNVLRACAALLLCAAPLSAQSFSSRGLTRMDQGALGYDKLEHCIVPGLVGAGLLRVAGASPKVTRVAVFLVGVLKEVYDNNPQLRWPRASYPPSHEWLDIAASSVCGELAIRLTLPPFVARDLPKDWDRDIARIRKAIRDDCKRPQPDSVKAFARAVCR